MENENNEKEQNIDEENTQTIKCVFISGLPYTATEAEVKEKFQSCGIIKYLYRFI